MPHFVFLSGPECGNVDAVDFYGVHFPRGVAVEVTDPFIAAKAKGNATFSEAPDMNGDGVTDKAELLAEAERRGVKVDKRWGVDKLQAALEAP